MYFITSKIKKDPKNVHREKIVIPKETITKLIHFPSVTLDRSNTAFLKMHVGRCMFICGAVYCIANVLGTVQAWCASGDARDPT